MPRASDIQPDKHISILLKSSPGLGKTLQACSFARYGPIWLAYFDKKSPTELYTFCKKYGYQDVLDNIEYDCYSAVNCNEYLNKLFQLTADPGRYIAGITDSATFLTAAAVNWSLGFKTKGGKKEVKDPTTHQILPDFDEYKVETSMITQALDICKSLPWYNIWTAHPVPTLKVEGSGEGKITQITKSNSIVSYGNKVAGIIPGAFTEIYHMSMQGGKRTVFTVGNGDDFAKTSLNLPPYFSIGDGELFAVKWKQLVNEGFDKLERKPLSNTDPNLSVSFDTTQSKWKV